MNEMVGITGIALSLIGIVIAVIQINKAKNAAEAAKVAAESATEAIHLNVTLADVSSCVNGIEEIKVMVRSERYEAALLRVTDISAKIIQLKSIPKSKPEHHVTNTTEMLTQLSVLRDLLEKKLQNSNVTISSSKINKILSSISDEFNAWIGRNKYCPSGEKSDY